MKYFIKWQVRKVRGLLMFFLGFILDGNNNDNLLTVASSKTLKCGQSASFSAVFIFIIAVLYIIYWISWETFTREARFDSH